MLDTLCTSQLFDAAPWLAIVLAWYAASLVCSRVLAEVLFFVARMCGKVDGAGMAKLVGKTAWELGRMFTAIGFGTPRRYIEARYEPRDKGEQ